MTTTTTAARAAATTPAAPCPLPSGLQTRRGPSVPEFVCNDIARVAVRTIDALPVDPYDQVRATGGFFLVDEESGDTPAAGMAEARSPAAREGDTS